MESQTQIRRVFTMDIARSNTLLCYLIFVHAVMFVSWATLLSRPIEELAAICLFGFSFIYYYRRYYCLSHAKSVIHLSRDSDQYWIIGYRSNSSQPLSLTGSYVSQYCVILYFKGAGFWDKPCALIMKDAVEPALFRLVQVYCRDPKTFLE